MPIPLCDFFALFDNAVVTSVATLSSACNVTFTSSLLIILAQPFVPPNVSLSGEPRRTEGFGCIFCLEDGDVGAVQKILSSLSCSLRSRSSLSPADCPGPSFSHLACRASPERVPTAVPLRPARPSAVSCPASMAHSALPIWSALPSHPASVVCLT